MVALCFLAWDSTASAQFSYQGQTVNSIGVVTNPHLDVAQFLPLISQKAGQPYSDESIRASIEALKKAGNFTKVVIDAEPDPTGLRINFILEPAYYIGMVHFPGATKSFTYTRLLQVINFQDERAFDKNQIPAQQSQLLEFLKANGYFAAKIDTHIDLDDVHELASPVFQVTLGKRARIGRVEIQSGSSGEDAWLLHSLRSLRARFTGGLLKPGKRYTAERIKSARTLLEGTLAKQHYLAHTVEFDQPRFHPDTNRVDISIKVKTGPAVDVQTHGARFSWIPFLSRRQEKKLIPIYSEGSVDRDLTQEGQQNLLNYFQRKGYFDAKVTGTFHRDTGKITVTYDIDKGRKHKVDTVSFTGNHQISSDDLRAHIPVKKHSLLSRGLFSQKLVNASVKNITALYRDIGYEDVKVTPQVVDREPKIEVTFSIEEGTRTVIGNVAIVGNEKLPIARLRPPGDFYVRPGTGFSSSRLSKDRSQILATYLNLGYLNADLRAQVTRRPDNPHIVDVSYVITENEQIRVSDVILIGQRVTRPSLIQQTANITPELPLSQSKLLEAESDLYNLGIFDWSSVGPKKAITDETEVQTLVKVHEAKRNAITYGFGFEATRRGGHVPTGTVAIPGLPTIGLGTNQVVASENTFVSPRGSVEYTRRNIRGLGEMGEISAIVSRLDQRAIASYTDPHFRNTRWNALTTLSLERTTENPLFAARLGDAAFQLERTLDTAKTTRLQLRYDFNKTRLSELLVPELVLDQDRNVRLSTVSATLIKDTRDKPLDAHRGIFGTLNIGLTPTALGSSVNFAKLFGQYSYYRPLKGTVWASSVRLGFASPFAGSFVPTSQLFFTGGGTTLRGFPLNAAGPQRLVPFCTSGTAPADCTNLISVPVGGEQLFVVNSELRFPLHLSISFLKPLGAVVFYDGGNVYSRINFNEFLNNYTHTVGIGLRYATPIGPVRIDLGHRLNSIPGVGSTQYFITLGQAF